MLYDVFISYKSEQEPQAARVRALLEAEGLRCWMAPDSIPAGSSYMREIPQGIGNSGVLLLLLNGQSQQSNWVLLELSTAISRHKKVFAVQTDTAGLNDEFGFCLTRSQIFPAQDPPLEDRVRELLPLIRMGAALGTGGGPASGTGRLQSRIPYPKSAFFGRQALLDGIQAQFGAGCQLVVLSGMGGIGKSEVAKQYAARRRDRYDTIVFVDCLNSLTDTFADDERFCLDGFARRRLPDGGQESNADYARRKLRAIREQSDGHTLIVLDNYDQPAPGERLSDWADARYDLLVTTRRDLSEAGYAQLPVEALNQEQLQALFEHYAGCPVTEEQEFARLCALVDGHTMMLELLAKQLPRSHRTLAGLRELLEQDPLGGPSEPVTLDGSREDTISGFIRRLFDPRDLTARQRTLLRCLSLCPTGGVELTAFAALAGLDDFVPLNGLIQCSWVRENRLANTVDLHPLVAETVRRELGLDPDTRAFVAQLTGALQTDPRKTRAEYAPYLDTGRSVLGLLPRQDLAWGPLALAFGAALNACSLLEESAQVLEDACRELRDSELYPMALLRLCQTGSARGEHARVLERLETLPALARTGAQGEALAQLLDLRGWCLMQTNRVREAEEAFRALLDDMDKGEYPGLPLYVQAMTVNDYGVTLYRQGRFGEAADQLREAYRMHRDLYGDDNLRVAIDLNNLGAICVRAGRYEEALTYHRRSLEIRQRVCGEVSYYTALQYDNAARAELDVWRLDGDPARMERAEAWARRSLELHQRLFGEKNPRVSRNLTTLGLLAMARQDTAGAEGWFRQARDMLLDPSQPRDERALATACDWLAGCLEAQDRREEARALYDEALTLRRRCLGPDHPDTRRTAARLAALSGGDAPAQR